MTPYTESSTDYNFIGQRKDFRAIRAFSELKNSTQKSQRPQKCFANKNFRAIRAIREKKISEPKRKIHQLAKKKNLRYQRFLRDKKENPREKNSFSKTSKKV